MSERSERTWEKGWDGHQRSQMLRLAKLPLAEKLEWLEETQRLAERLSRARKRPR